MLKISRKFWSAMGSQKPGRAVMSLRGRSNLWALISAGFLVMTALISDRGYACAVCGFGESSRMSFFVATLILTFVPLLAIGGIFYFVYKRAGEDSA